MRVRVDILSVVFCALIGTFACASRAYAQGMPYLCEVGLQAGCGYYVGDGTPHIFINPREAYGLHFRYKFTKRWAIQAKLSGQRIAGNVWNIGPGETPYKTNEMWHNQLFSGDIVAEFNFFRYDAANKYDKRIKPYSPYIFLGVGVSAYEPWGLPWEKSGWAGYIPLGIGFKWKFHERCGLNIAWQHNVYFSDDVENQTDTEHSLNDRYKMNGLNIMNCDVVGMLTVGLVIEFAKAKAPCRICNDD